MSVCCYGAHGGGAAAYSICVALNFFRAKDLTGLNLFDSCLKVMKSRMESEEPEKEVCGDCVAHLRFSGFRIKEWFLFSQYS